MTFAESTSVSAERSRAEIERVLVRFGATGFMYGWTEATENSPASAVIAFRSRDRNIKFILPMPSKNEKRFTHTSSRGTRRNPKQAEAAWEQATRSRWRALLLVIKAKLEAVESGITTFENEFLAHIVLPDGSTVGRWISPQISVAYESGSMPPLLPAYERES